MIIFSITLFSEGIKYLIPLPIPASIYGMLILFVLLCSKVLRIDQVKETVKFLIDIMPIMFIPAAVGLMDTWASINTIIGYLLVLTIVTTMVVMIVSGLITQIVIRKSRR